MIHGWTQEIESALAAFGTSVNGNQIAKAGRLSATGTIALSLAASVWRVGKNGDRRSLHLLVELSQLGHGHVKLAVQTRTEVHLLEFLWVRLSFIKLEPVRKRKSLVLNLGPLLIHGLYRPQKLTFLSLPTRQFKRIKKRLPAQI